MSFKRKSYPLSQENQNSGDTYLRDIQWKLFVAINWHFLMYYTGMHNSFYFYCCVSEFHKQFSHICEKIFIPQVT